MGVGLCCMHGNNLLLCTLMGLGATHVSDQELKLKPEKCVCDVLGWPLVLEVACHRVLLSDQVYLTALRNLYTLDLPRKTYNICLVRDDTSNVARPHR